VASDSPHHRPLGRSSSLVLAGSLLARSGSKPRVDTAEGAIRAQAVETPLSPQFGVREDDLGEADSQSFGGTWSKNLRLLKPVAVDANSASAEFGGTLKTELKSAKLPRGDIEEIVLGSLPSVFNTTLRMPDPTASSASAVPAEEQLAMKLSRLDSPPRCQTTFEEPGADSGAAESIAAEPNFDLTLSADLNKAPPAPSENPTLGSLSYTQTCTSSNFSAVSCIAAK
jgi:hypothetical protein